MVHFATVMKKPTRLFLSLVVGLGVLVLWAGCAKSYKSTLSPDLANQLNESLSFSQIKAFPEDHRENWSY